MFPSSEISLPSIYDRLAKIAAPSRDGENHIAWRGFFARAAQALTAPSWLDVNSMIEASISHSLMEMNHDALPAHLTSKRTGIDPAHRLLMITEIFHDLPTAPLRQDFFSGTGRIINLNHSEGPHEIRLTSSGGAVKIFPPAPVRPEELPELEALFQERLAAPAEGVSAPVIARSLSHQLVGT